MFPYMLNCPNFLCFWVLDFETTERSVKRLEMAPLTFLQSDEVDLPLESVSILVFCDLLM